MVHAGSPQEDISGAKGLCSFPFLSVEESSMHNGLPWTTAQFSSVILAPLVVKCKGGILDVDREMFRGGFGITGVALILTQNPGMVVVVGDYVSSRPGLMNQQLIDLNKPKGKKETKVEGKAISALLLS